MANGPGIMEEEIYEYDSSFESVHDDQVTALADAKEELAQACHDLQRKLKLANQEKDELLYEIDILTNQLNAQKNEPISSKNDENEKTIEIEELTKRNIQLEAELVEERLKFADLKDELSGELSKLTSAEETRLQQVVMVKDEIILLKESLDRSDLIIHEYERKIEEMTETQFLLQQENLALEQKNEKLDADMKKLIRNTAECIERERSLREELDEDHQYRPPEPNSILQYHQAFNTVRNTMSIFQWKRLTISSRDS